MNGVPTPENHFKDNQLYKDSFLNSGVCILPFHIESFLIIIKF